MKEKLQNHEVILGTMISEVATPNVARIMDSAGYEFIIVDCEHGYFDFSQISNIVSVSNGVGLTALVRIPVIERECITKVLDMGGDGFLVPQVNTGEDARKIVQYAKYPPIGQRGISTTRAHTNYNPPPLDQYVQAANRRTIILAQIESRQAVENAQAIASVEGIDALMVGPNDLAVDLGAPGHLQTPEMDAAIQKVIAASKAAGKPCGIIDSSVSFLQKWRGQGMTIFSCSSEVGMMMKTARANKKEFFEA